jgi:hypothetical protein
MSPALLTLAGMKFAGFFASLLSAQAAQKIVNSNTLLKIFKVRFITEFVLSKLFDTSSFCGTQSRPIVFWPESYANHQASPKTVLAAHHHAAKAIDSTFQLGSRRS